MRTEEPQATSRAGADATAHATTHDVTVDAPADTVYALLADATAWPLRFPPNIHVERTASGDGWERLRMWATANGEVKSWTSRRDLDPAARRIVFRQEASAPPVASMRGEWVVEPAGAAACTLTLLHEFSAVDDDPAGIQWIHEATDRNSRAELANVKALAEQADRNDELTFTFTDEVEINGPAEQVYTFLARAEEWPRRLPHVSRLDLREDVPGVQLMAMDTRTGDGSTHTTESVRVCFPESRIVYKQTVVPALMSAHTGEWSLRSEGTKVRAVSRHTVTLKEDAITSVLGPEATVASARSFIRRALGGNSTATLALAKQFAEAGGE
ncbi:aromatase/cyclase [Streptomyces sp. SID11385]|uniref:aromatase/cyclase n=1 Tax=Streptomyces sp. SID11385 TaxID=2706031 RepID=UPI0031BB2C7A